MTDNSEQIQIPPTSKKIARELFDACNAFKEDSKQWQRIAVAIQAAEEEIERLTRERDEFRSMVGPAEDIERENDRLREALERLTTDYLTVRGCLYMSAGQLKLWAENQNPELNSRIQYRDAERVLQETPSSDAVRNGLYGEPNSAPETEACQCVQYCAIYNKGSPGCRNLPLHPRDAEKADGTP